MTRERDPFSAALAAIREAAQQGAYAAGRPIVIVDEARRLGLSTTPVREALCWLCGERLIERSPTGGFLAPRLDPAAIRDRFGLRALLLRAALERGAGLAPSPTPTEGAPADRLAAAWTWRMRSLGDAALFDAYQAVDDRLRRLRPAEALLFPDLAAEADALLNAEPAETAAALDVYHQRRMTAAALLALEAEADGGPLPPRDG